MRIPRIYQTQALELDQRVRLDAQASQHLSKVLRLKPGDAVILFNGNGAEYFGHIEALEKRETRIVISECHQKNLESPLQTHLVQGISRGERMDYTVQKAVELGVQSIIPVITERTGVKLEADRRERRRQHWQNIVQSACEQCGRNRVPTVQPIQSLAQYLSPTNKDQTGTDSNCGQDSVKLVLHQQAEASLRTLELNTGQAICLLAGPEGGLSQADLEMAAQAGYQSIRLGPRILRTETAALAALAVLQLRWGDFL